jgi:hypothetical protein
VLQKQEEAKERKKAEKLKKAIEEEDDRADVSVLFAGLLGFDVEDDE